MTLKISTSLSYYGFRSRLRGNAAYTGELQDWTLRDKALAGIARFSWSQLMLITPAVLERSNSFVMESQYAGFPFQLITSENNVTAFC